MKKRMMAALLALFFVMGITGAAMAAKIKCTVESVEGETVTMTCEDAAKFKAGDKLKISAPKKAAIEGC